MFLFTGQNILFIEWSCCLARTACDQIMKCYNKKTTRCPKTQMDLLYNIRYGMVWYDMCAFVRIYISECVYWLLVGLSCMRFRTPAKSRLNGCETMILTSHYRRMYNKTYTHRNRPMLNCVVLRWNPKYKSAYSFWTEENWLCTKLPSDAKLN